MPAIASIFLSFEAIRYGKKISKKLSKDELERARRLTRSSKQRHLRGRTNLNVMITEALKWKRKI